MKKITIKKGGFVCRVAYGNESSPPVNTNLCKIFWRFLFMFFIYWPYNGLKKIAQVLLVLCGTIIACFVIAILFIFSFLFAKRPTCLKKDETGNKGAFIAYEHWPRIRGRRVYPIWIVTGILIVVYHKWIIFFAAALPSALWSADPMYSKELWIVLAISVSALAVLIGIYHALKKIKNSEVWMLLKESIKAKKQGLCLPVEIVE